jgi:hypothetical protein
LTNEPGVDMMRNQKDIQLYNHIIEYSNINLAFCDIIFKRSNIYLPFFDLFEDIIKENYKKNYERMVKLVESKLDTPIVILRLSQYYLNMKVSIDYPTLYEKCISMQKLYSEDSEGNEVATP